MPNTLTTSAVVDDTTDAGYRAWVSEIHNAFVTIGLTQSADTGQVDLTTATVPAANTFNYEIWEFTDALQTTAPIFFKIKYGSSYAAGYPMMAISAGSGSDGAGNLTPSGGVTVESALCVAYLNPTAASAVSRFVFNPTQGFLAMVWKIGMNPSSYTDQAFGGFMISRTNDSTGAPTADGCWVLAGGNALATYPAANPFMQAIKFGGTPTIYPPMGYVASYGQLGWGAWPMGAQTTFDGTDVSAVPILYQAPKIGASGNCGLALQSELAPGGTISLALVGTTAHTYLAVGRPLSTSYAGSNNTPLPIGMLILWE